MWKVINFFGRKGTGSSSTFIISMFSFYKMSDHNNVSQGCAKNTLRSHPPLLVPSTCDLKTETRQLGCTCVARPWRCGGIHVSVKCTCDCLFYVAFLNKQVGFEPWFQGFEGNKKTHSLAQCRKHTQCTLEPCILEHFVYQTWELYSILFRSLIAEALSATNTGGRAVLQRSVRFFLITF